MRGNNNLRIVVKDYDPVSSLVILHDNEGDLSDIMVPLKSIEDWRYSEGTNKMVRLQFYMKHIKKQGGKQTVFDMVKHMCSSKYYE